MEEILRAIIHLTNEMKEIKDGMGRMENEVQDLRNEMKEIKDEMKEIKDEMEEIKDGMGRMKEEIQDLRNEMARGFKSAMEERLEFFGIGSKFYILINERVEELEKKIG